MSVRPANCHAGNRAGSSLQVPGLFVRKMVGRTFSQAVFFRPFTAPRLRPAEAGFILIYSTNLTVKHG
jgi:hypothetical protein